MPEQNTSSYSLYSDIPDFLMEKYHTAGIVAVDTELHGLKLYRDEICLVQLCDDNQNVCLVKPEFGQAPKNLKNLMSDSSIRKLFHFALTDVAFFKTSLQIDVKNYRCTKIMSKLVRTYTDSHGLKTLCSEILGIELEKEQQQTNWASNELSMQQLAYAASDVIYLTQIYYALEKMIADRPRLSTGTTIQELNEIAQEMLAGKIELLIHGYGDSDWQTSLLVH